MLSYYFLRCSINCNLCSKATFRSSSPPPPTSTFFRTCVGVVLLLHTSMLVLMRPAVQTLSRSARRDCSLCWCQVLHLLLEHTLCFNTANHLAQEEHLHSTPLNHTHHPPPLTPPFAVLHGAHLYCPAHRCTLLSAHTSTLIFSLQLYSWSFSLDAAGGECCLCNRWPQLHTWVAVALNSLSDLS